MFAGEVGVRSAGEGESIASGSTEDVASPGVGLGARLSGAVCVLRYAAAGGADDAGDFAAALSTCDEATGGR